ncbi:MAG: efflux RND transporter periplasmic adaptor subunit [Alistipes sp.]
MKTHKLFLPFCMAMAFVSCGSPVREAAVVRPVKVLKVEALGAVEKSFSGAVTPDQYSDLAFKIGGPLVALNVVEGEMVRKGQVVAAIDPFDYQLQLDAKKSSYQTAKAQMDRAEKLLTRDAISHQDYEQTRASYDNAKSAYENAESQMRDTKLRAPFDGFIQKKYVENYQKVQPGTSIVCLIDPRSLQIRFTMPEGNLDEFLDSPEILVEFENYKGTFFKAQVKEYVQASVDGSGLPVSLKISDPRFNLKDYNIAVGFTCKVILRMKDNTGSAVTIPVSSAFTVSGSHDLCVYILDPKDSTVHRRVVKNDGFAGRDGLVITDGLKNDELVVIAGSKRLVEGQQVKILTE